MHTYLSLEDAIPYSCLQKYLVDNFGITMTSAFNVLSKRSDAFVTIILYNIFSLTFGINGAILVIDVG